jgi:hypothetical protein
MTHSTETLLERIYDAEHSPAELAQQMGVSLADLARWAAEPGNTRFLAALVRLTDVRAQIIISRYRATAAAQLANLSVNQDEADLARKACVDLLRCNLHAFDAGDAEPPQPPRPNEESILAALEQLGEEE